jgi:hypothetical protein
MEKKPEWVQFAVRVRESGVKEVDLIKHYFQIPEYLISEAIKKYSYRLKKVDYLGSRLDLSSKVRFTRGYSGSVEFIAKDIKGFERDVKKLFKGKYELPKDFKSFLS